MLLKKENESKMRIIGITWLFIIASGLFIAQYFYMKQGILGLANQKEVYISGVGVLCISVVICINLSRLGTQGKSLWWITPPTMIGLWLLVAYAGPGWLSLVDATFVQDLSNSDVLALDQLPSALYIIIGGYCILSAFCFLSIGQTQFELTKQNWLKVIKLNRLYYIYLISLTCKVYLLTTIGVDYGSDIDNLGEGSNYFQLLSLFSNLTYIFITIYLFISIVNRNSLSIFWIIFAFETLYGLSSGLIKPVFYVLLSSGFGWVLANIWLKSSVLQHNNKNTVHFLAGRKALQFIGVILGLIIGVYAVPINEGLRYTINRENRQISSLDSMIEGVKRAHELTWDNGVQNGLNIFIQRIGGRQSGVINSIAVIVGRLDGAFADKDYLGVEPILLAPLYLVPRFIWKSKPTLSKGKDFSIEWLNQPQTTRSSTAMSWMGDGYISQGLLGVFLVCLSLGIVFGFIYKITVIKGAFIVYVAFLPTMLNVEGEYTTTILSLIQQSILMVFVWKFITGQTVLNRAPIVNREVYKSE